MGGKKFVAFGLVFSIGVVSACGSNGVDDRNLSFSKTTTTVKYSKPTTTLALKPVGSSSESEEKPESDVGGQSSIDPASFGNGPGLPTGGSAGTASLWDCFDAILSDSTAKSASDSTVSHVTTLVTMYSEANNGIIDCSDGGRLWEDIMDWVTKLIAVKIPPVELVHRSFAPYVWEAEGKVVWLEDTVRVSLPAPGNGEIYAYDIDEGTGVGTPWILDHIEYRVRPCTEPRFSEFARADGLSFGYEYSVRERNYRDNDPTACFDAETISYGVHLDGSPSEYTKTSGPERFVLKNLEKEDQFIVVGFGDSYGSGEGNPASGTDWDDRPFFASDENTMAFPESLFWPEGDLAEFGVNTTAHDQCHRSSESGLGKAIAMLGSEYQGDILFGHFACSGAISFNIWAAEYTPDFWGFEQTQDRQIDQALDWLSQRDASPGEVDAVVVSIGGNDVGFSDVIYDCFIEAGDCNDEDDTRALRRLINTDLPNRVQLVAEVVAQVFPNAEIFFTSYTDGISVSRRNSLDLDDDGACSYDDDPWFGRVEWDSDEFWDVRDDDARWIIGFLEDLNRQLAWQARFSGLDAYPSIRENINDQYQNSAWMNRRILNLYPGIDIDNGGWAQGRVHIISAQFDEFRNNGFCAGPSRRNIMFNSEAGDRQGLDQAFFWSSGGWHPNDYGYELYGDAIAAALIEAFPERTRNLGEPR